MLKMYDFFLHALLIEPRLRVINGNIIFESVSDYELQRINQYFTTDTYSKGIKNIDVSITQSGCFTFCLPDLREIIISMPIWKNISLNPLHDPMFVLGESWLMDLQDDGTLVISLPEVNGKREKFLFSEHVWRNWIGSDDNIQPQSLMETYAKQNDERNVSVNSVQSLMDIDTSDIAKLLADVEILADLLSMDWLSETQINKSIDKSKYTDSMCEDTQLNINEQLTISTSGYDASIEVSANQINHLEINMI